MHKQHKPELTNLTEDFSQYGSALTGLGGGVAAPQYAEPQAASPFSTALTTALGVGGLYGKIFGK